MNAEELVDQICEYFDLQEIKELCFQLGIPHDEIPGDTRRIKARELTDYCRRRGRVDELIRRCRQSRPNVEWRDFQEGGSGRSIPADGQVGITPGSIPASNVPQVPGMFWMSYPNTWYGPFAGYYIQWLSIGGFQVWHPFFGPIPYPDPYHQFQRNVWVRLINSPFNVFVEWSPNGYVFGQYSPY